MNWINFFVEQCVDLYLSFVDGCYWFIVLVFGYDVIEICSVDSFVGLVIVLFQVIWCKYECGLMSWYVWVFELYCIDGCWFVYFVVVECDDIWKLCMYVFECEGDDLLMDVWVECGCIGMFEEGFLLDVMLFEYGGCCYFCWVQKSLLIESNFYLVELVNFWMLKLVLVVISCLEFVWECIGFYVNEGLVVFKCYGCVFIVYLVVVIDVNYCMGLLWVFDGVDLLDLVSWYKLFVLVFKIDEVVGQFGFGYNSFMMLLDGWIDLFVYYVCNYCDIVGDLFNDFNCYICIQVFGWCVDGFFDFGIFVVDGFYVF